MNFSLDWLLSYLRYKKVIKHIVKDSVVCDIGCGLNANFLKLANSSISLGIGFDKKIENWSSQKLILKKIYVLDKIPLESNSVDAITMMAMIEHLTNPQAVLNDCFRVLKNGGKLILTTPSPIAKPVLEILSFKLKLIEEDEIKDHKNYFWPSDITDMLTKTGFSRKNIKNKYFQLGFNILTVVIK